MTELRNKEINIIWIWTVIIMPITVAILVIIGDKKITELDKTRNELHQCNIVVEGIQSDIQSYQDSLLDARRELAVWRQRPFN